MRHIAKQVNLQEIFQKLEQLANITNLLKQQSNVNSNQSFRVKMCGLELENFNLSLNSNFKREENNGKG